MELFLQLIKNSIMQQTLSEFTGFMWRYLSNILSKLTPETQESLELDESSLHKPKISTFYDLHFELQYKTLSLQKNRSFLALNDVKR